MHIFEKEIMDDFIYLLVMSGEESLNCFFFFKFSSPLKNKEARQTRASGLWPLEVATFTKLLKVNYDKVNRTSLFGYHV